MTSAHQSSLEIARRILAHLVLRGATIRAAVPVPDGPPILAVHPAGVLPAELRDALKLKIVRQIICTHMTRGAARFGQDAPDVHSIGGTCAGFAHLQICCLTAEQRDLFEERSAVREYDGGQCRPQAELFALFDVLEHASVIEAVALLSAA